jgi:hypothetical protein
MRIAFYFDIVNPNGQSTEEIMSEIIELTHLDEVGDHTIAQVNFSKEIIKDEIPK